MYDAYEGAIVLEPKCNLYLNHPIPVGDFASLYPSSMISENLCHSSKVWTKSYNLQKELIYETTRSYEYSLNIYYDIVENASKNEEIKKLQTDIYLTIDTIKEYIKEYEFSNNKQFITDTIELYIKDMIPKLKEFNNKKYAINYVDCNDKICSLIQIPYYVSNENLEWDISVDNKQGIVSMVYGMENTTSSLKKKKEKDKTLKNKPPKDLTKQRTKRKKESIIKDNWASQIDWGSDNEKDSQEK
jgi:hypothetical protein